MIEFALTQVARKTDMRNRYIKHAAYSYTIKFVLCSYFRKTTNPVVIFMIFK